MHKIEINVLTRNMHININCNNLLNIILILLCRVYKKRKKKRKFCYNKCSYLLVKGKKKNERKERKILFTVTHGGTKSHLLSKNIICL